MKGTIRICGTVPQASALYCWPQYPLRSFSTTQPACLAAPVIEKRRTVIPSSQLSYHWSSEQPTIQQLAHASQFFEKTPPRFLWSAEKFKTIVEAQGQEVCFLGRSNVGKSSILNALMHKTIAHTSSRPGRTRMMNAFGAGKQDEFGKERLVIMDMPGYGKGGQAAWGTEIVKYLQSRQNLKRAFLLIDSEHGIKKTDRQILDLFREHGVPFQVVLSKVDKILFTRNKFPSQENMNKKLATLREYMDAVREVVSDLELDVEIGEVLACSAEKRVEGKFIGIDAVRHAMLSATGLESKDQSALPPTPEIVSFEDLVYTKDSSPI